MYHAMGKEPTYKSLVSKYIPEFYENDIQTIQLAEVCLLILSDYNICF